MRAWTKTNPETVSSCLFFDWGLGDGKSSEAVDGGSHQPFFLAHNWWGTFLSMVAVFCYSLVRRETTAINVENLILHLEALPWKHSWVCAKVSETCLSCGLCPLRWGQTSCSCSSGTVSTSQLLGKVYLVRILSALAEDFWDPPRFLWRNRMNTLFELVSYSQGSNEMLLRRLEEMQRNSTESI